MGQLSPLRQPIAVGRQFHAGQQRPAVGAEHQLFHAARIAQQAVAHVHRDRPHWIKGVDGLGLARDGRKLVICSVAA